MTTKTAKQKQSTIVIRQLMSARGIMIRDILQKLKITYPTARVFLNDPKLFDGHQRRALASLLTISVDVVDDIINGRITKIDDVFVAAQ